MVRHRLLVGGIVPLLAVACTFPVLATDQADSGNFAGDGDLVARFQDGVADQANPANFAGNANPVGEAQGTEKAAEPGIAICCGTNLAPKPEAIGSERALDRLFGYVSCRPCPRVYGDVEAVFLQEASRFRTQPIAVDWITGTTLQSTSNLSAGNTPGLQITFGMRLCDCRSVEFSYLGLFRNGGSAVFQNTNPNAEVTFPTGPVGNVFLNMDRVESDYSSYLNSFELNFPCCCCCCMESKSDCDKCGCEEGKSAGYGCATAGCDSVFCRSVEWFAGFRYVNIGSDLNIAASAYPAPYTENAAYTVHAGNRLFGGQLGGRLRGTLNRFGLELTGKAGIYGNAADQSQTVVDYPNYPLRPTTSTLGGDVAFMGEINLSGIYRLSDAWSLKAGYNLIWIEGLALAPDQLDFNIATSPSGNQLSTDGGIFLYGANVGIEARW